MSDPAHHEREPTDQAELGLYQHVPLSLASNQIRLLKVTREDSSTRNSRLAFALETHSLDEAPPFHALSYVWGPPSSRYYMTVDGSRMEIRQNLSQFLRRLEEGSVAAANQAFLQKYLGICQKRSEEGETISAETLRPFLPYILDMCDIDEGGDGSGNALNAILTDDAKWVLDLAKISLTKRKLVRKVFEDNFYLWIDQVCIDQSNLAERSQQVRLMGEVYTKAESVIAWLGEPQSPQWDTFNDVQMRLEVIRCEYWTRVWVLQEFRLARRVNLLFGDIVIAIIDKDLRDSGLIGRLDMAPGATAIASRLMVFQGSGRENIDEWMYDLTAASRMKCGIPHDRIYGLLGLWSGMAEFPIDYSKAAPEVFWDAMDFCLPAIERDRCPMEGSDTGIEKRLAEVGYLMGVRGTEAALQRPPALRVCALLWPGRSVESVFSTENLDIKDMGWHERAYELVLEEGIKQAASPAKDSLKLWSRFARWMKKFRWRTKTR